MALVVKNPLTSAGDLRDPDSIPGMRRSPGAENGNPLQYSCLKNPMDWWATADISEPLRTNSIALPWVPGEQKRAFTINQTTWHGLKPQVNKDTFIRQDIPGVQRPCFKKQSRASAFFGMYRL